MEIIITIAFSPKAFFQIQRKNAGYMVQRREKVLTCCPERVCLNLLYLRILYT